MTKDVSSKVQAEPVALKPVPWSQFCGGRWYRWLLSSEWLAEWILYTFQRFALLKVVVNGLVAASIVGGIVMFYLEIDDRKTSRAIRRATMLATMVQVARTAKDAKTVNPVVPILETLVQQKMNLSGLSLPGANLKKARLSGANLERAKLQGATLSEIALMMATLIKADLSEANLNRTSLTEADLSGATFSRANLSGAKELNRAQLVLACADKEGQPILPDAFKEVELKPCPKKK